MLEFVIVHLNRVRQPLILIAALLGLSVIINVSPIRAEVNWPASQLLPSFPTPATTLDYINLESRSNDERSLFTSLQGVVNRNQPRIYIEEGNDIPEFTWLNNLNLGYTVVSDPFSLITTYRSELAGLVIFDPAQPATRNLATTIAGLNNYVVASPDLASILNADPYNLPTQMDLRSLGFTSALQVYQYAYDNYWSQTTRRLIIGLNPDTGGYLREYAVATRAMIVWLNARDGAENDLLRRFLSEMPLNAPYMGWFPDPENAGEQAAVNQLSSFGLVALAADFSANLTVYGGMSRNVNPPSAPTRPPLENRIYVMMVMSDGDNVQYTARLMRKLWDDPGRGQAVMGWTISPALVDIAPQILNYYWSTTSPNDYLISGPSGYGYAYPNSMPGGGLTTYTQNTAAYLNAAGLRVITLWQNDASDPTDMVRNAYQQNMPGLLGLTTQNEGNPGVSYINGALPIIGFRESYGGSEAELRQGIDALVSGWSGAGPLFIAVQGTPFAPFGQPALTPTSFRNVQQSYASNPNIIFVRPDHFFQLIQERNQLQPPTTQTIFTFDGDLQGWSTSTSGKQYDSVSWTNTTGNPAGAVRLDGSDLGLPDDTPNASIARQIILPSNAATLTFDTRGSDDLDKGGKLRVRLVTSGGASVTLLDYERVIGPTWASRSVDISAFAGQTVTLYFEQNDNQFGIGEQRYIDNVRIDSAASSATQWTFDNDTQGWAGVTAGGEYDRADWVTSPGNPGGALRLDGSDLGIPNDQPNAWFSQQINLPSNAATLTFDTRGSDDGDKGGKLRVRLMTSGGASVTLLDYERVIGPTWVSRSVDISAFVGQTVTLYFEQNDNQFGIGEQRYIDNVRIDSTANAMAAEMLIPDDTPILTETPTPTATETASPTLTITPTETPTATETASPTATTTPTNTDIPTPSPTMTPLPTETQMPTSPDVPLEAPTVEPSPSV